MKTIFLDRDGVLNRETTGLYITQATDFELLPEVLVFLKTLQERGYQFIIITNQGGIEKGLYSHEALSEVHAKMTGLFETEGIAITSIYYCPHHIELGTKCLCRKPNSLMLEKAIARFKVDVQASYFIGDKWSDLEAGERVGLKGLKSETNASLIPLLEKIA